MLLNLLKKRNYEWLWRWTIFYFFPLLIWLHYFLLQCSGRELFLSNASLFVDDAEAYDVYQREPESYETEENVSSLFMSVSA